MRSSDPLWKTHPIEYLAHAKFPDLAECHATMLSKTGYTSEAQNRTIEEANKYRSYLGALSGDQLAELLKEARAGEAERLREQSEKREREQPFNQPYAKADFAYWASASYWSPDEGVALSFGKSPVYANWKALELIRSYSPFAQAFASRRHIVLRAKEMGQLWDKTTPANFLAWANRMRFEMPAELVEAVTSLGIQVGDWKSLYDGMSALFEQVKAQLAEERTGRLADLKARNEKVAEMQEDMRRVFDQYKDLLAKKEAIVEERGQIIEAQNRQIAELEARSAAGIKVDKALGARERDSLLKLVIGMARKGYGYDPKSGRSPVAKEIAGDLASVGIPMDEDTVRKYLAEAKELLPGDETEQKR